MVDTGEIWRNAGWAEGHKAGLRAALEVVKERRSLAVVRKDARGAFDEVVYAIQRLIDAAEAPVGGEKES